MYYNIKHILCVGESPNYNPSIGGKKMQKMLVVTGLMVMAMLMTGCGCRHSNQNQQWQVVPYDTEYGPQSKWAYPQNNQMQANDQIRANPQYQELYNAVMNALYSGNKDKVILGEAFRLDVLEQVAVDIPGVAGGCIRWGDRGEATVVFFGNRGTSWKSSNEPECLGDGGEHKVIKPSKKSTKKKPTGKKVYQGSDEAYDCVQNCLGPNSKKIDSWKLHQCYEQCKDK